MNVEQIHKYVYNLLTNLEYYMNDFSILQNIVQENNSFLLTTHVNPDADAIGSELAFYEVLKILGKKVKVVNHSTTPYNLEFMDEENIIEKFDETVHSKIFDEADVIVVLDLNQANRVVKMEDGLRSFKGTKICIDHHQDSENFVDHFFGSVEYSATGEIIYDFIEQTKIVELDKRISDLLYAAIMTDTGSFRFERTTPKLHRITANLLEYGANPTDIYDKIYDQFKFGRIKLLGEALRSITLNQTREIAVMKITRDDLEKNGATEADVDGFVNYCLSIKGVKMGILLYEMKDGIKISFRSKGEIHVNKLAAEFGGGGHSNASGARLFNTTIDKMKEKIITAAQKYFEQ